MHVRFRAKSYVKGLLTTSFLVLSIVINQNSYFIHLENTPRSLISNVEYQIMPKTLLNFVFHGSERVYIREFISEVNKYCPGGPWKIQ